MNLPYNLKFDQLAIAAFDFGLQDELTIANEGSKWNEDCVTTIGRNVDGQRISNVARLRFNYDMWPMEYEVLNYIDGWNWPTHYGLVSRHINTCVSHYGVHIESWQREAFAKRWKCVQDSITVRHTNSAVPAHRNYRYSIFDARKETGTFVKTIVRLSNTDGSFNDALKELNW